MSQSKIEKIESKLQPDWSKCVFTNQLLVLIYWLLVKTGPERTEPKHQQYRQKSYGMMMFWKLNVPNHFPRKPVFSLPFHKNRNNDHNNRRQTENGKRKIIYNIKHLNNFPLQKHTLKDRLGPKLEFGGGGDDTIVDPGVSKRSQRRVKT